MTHSELPGKELPVGADTDGLDRLLPYRTVAEENEGLLAGVDPADRSMVDELLAERRREAALEDADP